MRHCILWTGMSLLFAIGQARITYGQYGSPITVMRSYSGGSSAAEGYMNGRAETLYAQAAMMAAQAEMVKAQAMLIESHGKTAESSARVREMDEKTRAAGYDNAVKRAQTHYDKKRVKTNYVAERAQSEALTPHRNLTGSLPPPQRLDRDQFDPDQGIVHWPATFDAEGFQEHRTQLDKLFSSRVAKGVEVDDAFPGHVQEVAKRMHAQLNSQARQLHPTEFIAARRFLNGLTLEAAPREPIDGLAAR